MKCHIVEDLLPEYIEDLCSEETRLEIEAHLADCENCRKKSEAMQENEGKPAAGFDEIQPFKKIEKELKKNRIKKVVAIVLLILVCGVFGILTVGQIFPSLSCPSYDSLMYRYRAKQIARKLVDGKIEEVLKDTGTSFDASNMNYWSAHDPFFYDVAEHLSESYEKAFKGKGVTIDVDGVTYSNNSDDAERYWTPDTNIQYSVYRVDLMLKVEDKTVFMVIIFEGRYNYRINIRNEEEKYADPYFAKEDVDTFEYCIRDMNYYFNYYRDACIGCNVARYIMSRRINLLTPERVKEIGEEGFASGFYTLYFVEDCMKIPLLDEEAKTIADYPMTQYDEKVGKSLYQIVSRCKSNDFQLTEGVYNKDEKKYDAVLYWRVTDRKGKQCILAKNFYYGPFGYEPVDDKEIICPEAGFDREVTAELEKIFD